MTPESEPKAGESQDAPRGPFWKNPFVIGFALGALFLTALPFLQRPFLKAPAPVYTLPAWELPTLSGGTVGSATLSGKVWLVSFVAAPCDSHCVERQQAFGRELGHVDDLGPAIELVTVVLPDAGEALLGLAHGAPPSWHFAGGSLAQLTPVLASFRTSWDLWAHTDAGATALDFAALPGFGLVDQTGAVRGFWKDDVAGRGNLVMAARLLAKHGPAP